ncbi:MAG: hypothetical protein QOF36_962, partial [Microbacteriaceae bacterium]|nr:hypothetical protein [Microbacteriaceae bacterium]
GVGELPPFEVGEEEVSLFVAEFECQGAESDEAFEAGPLEAIEAEWLAAAKDAGLRLRLARARQWEGTPAADRYLKWALDHFKACTSGLRVLGRKVPEPEGDGDGAERAGGGGDVGGGDPLTSRLLEAHQATPAPVTPDPALVFRATPVESAPVRRPVPAAVGTEPVRSAVDDVDSYAARIMAAEGEELTRLSGEWAELLVSRSRRMPLGAD